MRFSGPFPKEKYAFAFESVLCKALSVTDISYEANLINITSHSVILPLAYLVSDLWLKLTWILIDSNSSYDLRLSIRSCCNLQQCLSDTFKTVKLIF